MPKNKKQSTQQDPLPEDFGSLEEFCEFCDTHSTSDYEDFMEDVDVCIDIHTSKVYCAVEKDLRSLNCKLMPDNKESQQRRL
jgi:hypothetical protein